MEALPCAAALVTFLIIFVFLLTPLSLEFDTDKKSFQVGWVGIYIRIRLGRRKTGRLKAEHGRKRKSHVEAIGLFLIEESDFIFELLRKARHPLMKLLQSVSIRHIEVSLSTLDPLWNGVLYGICLNLYWENVNLLVNFRNLNYVKGELQLYPYKIIDTALRLLIGLPHQKLIRAFLAIRGSSGR